ncbi:hypothetical protein KCU91_g127, partial [Aureobasidium melanogenum]
MYPNYNLYPKGRLHFEDKHGQNPTVSSDLTPDNTLCEVYPGVSAACCVVASPSQDAIVHLFSKCLGSCLMSRLDLASPEEDDQNEVCFARCCDQRRNLSSSRILMRINQAQACRVVARTSFNVFSEIHRSISLVSFVMSALSMQCTINLEVPSMDVDHRMRMPPVNQAYLRRQAIQTRHFSVVAFVLPFPRASGTNFCRASLFVHSAFICISSRFQLLAWMACIRGLLRLLLIKRSVHLLFDRVLMNTSICFCADEKARKR